MQQQGTTQTHLVLTRRRDESIMIGDDITITILQVDGGKVRLRILAPKDVKILREELYTPPTEKKQ